MSIGNDIQKGYEGSKAEDTSTRKTGITAAKDVKTPSGRKGVGNASEKGKV